MRTLRIFYVVLLSSVLVMMFKHSFASETAKERITWESDHGAALKRAVKEKKLIVLDLFATWCGPCKMIPGRFCL